MHNVTWRGFFPFHFFFHPQVDVLCWHIRQEVRDPRFFGANTPGAAEKKRRKLNDCINFLADLNTARSRAASRWITAAVESKWREEDESKNDWLLFLDSLHSVFSSANKKVTGRVNNISLRLKYHSNNSGLTVEQNTFYNVINVSWGAFKRHRLLLSYQSNKIISYDLFRYQSVTKVHVKPPAALGSI